MAGRIAVVGAGIAGLACARGLAAAGLAVELFDKSPGLGGRCATRRRQGPEFDHGAPAFPDPGGAFGAALAGWAAQGLAARWPAADDDQGGPAWVGLPGLRDLAAAPAAGLSPRHGCRVTGLGQARGGWTLALADGSGAGPFDAVALAVPAPQAAALLGARAPAFPALAAVEMTPTWTVMAAWEGPLPPATAAVVAGDGAPLARAIANHLKPGRDPARPAWVMQAGAGWSAAHLEDPPGPVGAALLAAFGRALGAALDPPATLMVHRWRHALTARPAGEPCLWSAGLRLGLAGDWCLGARLPDAWASGRALAAAIAGEMGVATDGGPV